MCYNKDIFMIFQVANQTYPLIVEQRLTQFPIILLIFCFRNERYCEDNGKFLYQMENSWILDPHRLTE